MSQKQDPRNKKIEGRIAEVLHDVIRRRLSGESLSDENVLKAHPELSPELDRRLADLRLVELARGTPKSAPTEDVAEIWDGRPPVENRCHTSPVTDPFRAAELPEIPGFAIKGEIHRGGQGVVFRAVQQSTHREVAVKVVRGGPMGGPHEAARFDREVSILARLNHPNIVTVFDSGATGGHSYYAMRLIEGQTITAFADGRKMSVGDTVRFFVKVCDAVATAHQLGIIHRDLKPGNILVDAAGEPQVLDFGLAKVVEASDGGFSLGEEMTQEGQFVGTLAWAAPEQVSGGAAIVDARTDLYALGLILYRLLTGNTPYPMSGSARDVMNRIVTSVPKKPRSFRKELNRELETIVLKTLEKSPDRRYASVSDLAADLRRHLNHEPITACPPSTIYELRKFAQRNKLVVTAVSIALLGLTLGLGSATISLLHSQRSRVQADRRRAEAEAVVRFMNGFLRYADPRVEPEDLTVRQAMAKAEQTVDAGSLKGNPGVEAAVRRMFGVVYTGSTQYDEARRQLQNALNLYASLPDEYALDRAHTLRNMAFYYLRTGQPAKAEELSFQALKIAAAKEGDAHPQTLHTQVVLAFALARQGKAADAIRIANRVLDGCNHLSDVTEAGRLQTDALTVLARAHLEGENYEQARTLAEEALRLRRESLLTAEDEFLLADTLSVLGDVHTKNGKYAQAEEMVREALGVFKRFQVPSPYAETAAQLAEILRKQGDSVEAEAMGRLALEVEPSSYAMLVLADILGDKGQLHEAEELLRAAIDARESTSRAGQKNSSRAKNGLGIFLINQGRLPEAETILREAVSEFELLHGSEHHFTTIARVNLGNVLSQQGQLKEAEPLLNKSLRTQQQTLGMAHPTTLNTLALLGDQRMYAGRIAEAQAAFEEVDSGLRAALGDDHPSVYWNQTKLGWVRWARREYAAALPFYEQSYDGLQRRSGPMGVQTRKVRQWLVNIGIQARRFDVSANALSEGLEVELAALGSLSPDVGRSRFGLGRCFVEMGRFDEAAEQLELALEAGLQAAPDWGKPAETTREGLLARTRVELGGALSELRCFKEAEQHLLAAWDAYCTDRSIPYSQLHHRLCAERLVRLYELWQVDPHGADQEVALETWRTRLEQGL